MKVTYDTQPKSKILFRQTAASYSGLGWVINWSQGFGLIFQFPPFEIFKDRITLSIPNAR
jgi:hypothetical protein